MPSTNLHTLERLQPQTLDPVVRQAARRPDLQVTDFTVALLSDQGVTSQDSLFLVRGHAQAGQSRQAWALVVKTFTTPDEDADPGHLLFLAREVEAYRSGLLTSPSAGLRAPRAYAVTEQEGQTWLWLEHVTESVGRRWTLDEYTRAARQLGEWHGSVLTRRPLPDTAWLLRDLVRQWSSMFGPGGGEAPHRVPSAFTPALTERIQRTWEQRAFFLGVLGRLPQVFSHFDFHRRNLLMQAEAVVALDWAWCGLGPEGGDLVSLVGSTCMFGEWDVGQIGPLEAAVFAAYVAGLRQAGWSGDERLVRLGYAAWMPLHFGVTAPTLVAFWTQEQRQARARQLFGAAPDELAARWTALCEWSLARADEARALWDWTGDTLPGSTAHP
ncbi:phosphotransferase [Deinococcus ficus]|uniref:Uncharacterized protein n=1 Tax=Deinococcus ficus TaxID=317577 RepID=A0A221T0E6_9DEIO|nr:phosphotransferase [Deinococcus ficus]ASN82359.1 hypothetical protein DFI_14305 [Deinococcus ficus]